MKDHHFVICVLIFISLDMGNFLDLQLICFFLQIKVTINHIKISDLVVLSRVIICFFLIPLNSFIKQEDLL